MDPQTRNACQAFGNSATDAFVNLRGIAEQSNDGAVWQNQQSNQEQATQWDGSLVESSKRAVDSLNNEYNKARTNVESIGTSVGAGVAYLDKAKDAAMGILLAVPNQKGNVAGLDQLDAVLASALSGL